jgi:hypothetical protein
MPMRPHTERMSAHGRRRFAPAVEGCEARTLLAAPAPAAVADPTAFHGFLAPYDKTGPLNNVTNVSRPTIVGNAPPNSIVTVSAIRFGSDPTQAIPLGQAIANSVAAWSVNAPFLPDGSYAIVGTAVRPVTTNKTTTPVTSDGGDPSVPITLIPSLVIDTIAPRVAHVAFDPASATVEVVLSDAGSGIDMNKAANPLNYTIVPPGHVVGGFAPQSATPNPTPAPAIAGFYTSAVGETVVLAFAKPLPRGRYLFQISSGGVTDLAGNALDGEFTGRYPSGNGAPGGNFIARLTVTGPAATPALRSRHRARA